MVDGVFAISSFDLLEASKHIDFISSYDLIGKADLCLPIHSNPFCHVDSTEISDRVVPFLVPISAGISFPGM